MNNSRFKFIAEQDTIPKIRQDTSKQLISDSLKTKQIFLVNTYKRSKVTTENINANPINKTDSSYYLTPKTTTSLFCDYQKSSWIEKKSALLSTEPGVKRSFTSSTHLIAKNDKRFNLDNIQINREMGDNTTLFVLIISSIVALAIITQIYKKYINQLFEATIYKFAASRLVKGKKALVFRLVTVLDLLYLGSLGLLIFLAISLSESVIVYQSPIKSIILVILLLLGLRIYKFIIHKAILFATGYWEFGNELFQNFLLFSRAISIVIAPLVFFAVYTPEKVGQVIVYSSLIIVGISLIMRTLRLFKLFVDNGFSIFYFILYLCALEFVPLLIVCKVVNFE